MTPDPIEIYPSLADFYNANPARQRSPELDFGVMWRAAGRSHPQWRISYVDLTGELYAYELGAAGSSALEVLERLPLRPCEACAGTGGPDFGACHRCGGTGFSRLAVDAVLAGWADVCGDEGSLEWARRRAAGERVPAPSMRVAS